MKSLTGGILIRWCHWTGNFDQVMPLTWGILDRCCHMLGLVWEGGFTGCVFSDDCHWLGVFWRNVTANMQISKMVGYKENDLQSFVHVMWHKGIYSTQPWDFQSHSMIILIYIYIFLYSNIYYNLLRQIFNVDSETIWILLEYCNFLFIVLQGHKPLCWLHSVVILAWGYTWAPAPVTFAEDRTCS